MLYSKKTGGFYDPEINGNNIPEDAVEISSELHSELISGQSLGKQISSDQDGFPMLVDIPSAPISYKTLRAAEYPPMSDYLDGIVKGDQAQVDKYIADCQAVKAKYPKPE